MKKGLWMKGCCKLLVVAVLALLSCTAPLYESAQVHKGFSAAGGLGLGRIGEGSGAGSFGSVSVLGRFGLSERVALGLQSTLFPIIERMPNNDYDLDYGLEAYLCAKLKRTGHSALLVGVGVPRPVNVAWLQDIGDAVTVRIGAGGPPPFGLALDCAVDLHPVQTGRLRPHVSGSTCFYAHFLEWGGDLTEGYAYSAGIGLEFLPGAK